VRISVYLALLGALALCLLARRAAGSLRPPLAVVTLTVSAVLAAAAWVWNLALLVGPLVGRLGFVAGLGHWSVGTLAAYDPVPNAAALGAGVLIAVGAVAVVACLSRVARELLQARATTRSCPAGTDDGVVVVDDRAVWAVAVPGVRGRVVLTTGMVRALDADERRVLLAHERAHLRHQHALYRVGVRATAALLPLLRPMVADCDYHLERWADEEAALAVGDRELAATALAHAALAARRHSVGAAAPLLGFSGRGVPGRVEALLAAPPSVRVLPTILPLALSVAVAAATLEASRDVEALFELAMRLWTG